MLHLLHLFVSIMLRILEKFLSLSIIFIEHQKGELKSTYTIYHLMIILHILKIISFCVNADVVSL